MKRALVVAAGLLLLFVLFAGTSLASYFRGVGGELSVTTLLLVSSSISAFAFGLKPPGRQELETLATFVLLAGAFLYPMSLGLTSFDPYALGYPERVRALLLALAPVAVYASLRGRFLLLLALALAVVAHRFELLESGNLWDYLLDPWLVLGMAGFTIFARFSKSR